AHLLDSTEQLWGQHDGEPVGGARPTTSWAAGEAVDDRVGVPVLEETPPGRYEVEVGLYDPETGDRLPVEDPSREPLGDRLIAGGTRIGPRRRPIPPLRRGRAPAARRPASSGGTASRREPWRPSSPGRHSGPGLPASSAGRVSAPGRVNRREKSGHGAAAGAV